MAELLPGLILRIVAWSAKVNRSKATEPGSANYLESPTDAKVSQKVLFSRNS